MIASASGRISSSKGSMASSHHSERISGIALAVWLAVQLATLGAGAGRLQFWARAPDAGEQLALLYMVAAQVVAGSLLFPYLLADLRCTILAIVTAWPMAQLAGIVSDTSAPLFAIAEVYVSMWLLGLFFWSAILRSDWSKLLGAAIATMFAIGGPLLFYLRSEFADGANFSPQSYALYGPVSGVISLIVDGPANLAWAIPVILNIIGGAIFFIWKQRIISRQVIHQ
jgi:hypothetical protein